MSASTARRPLATTMPPAEVSGETDVLTEEVCQACGLRYKPNAVCTCPGCGAPSSGGVLHYDFRGASPGSFERFGIEFEDPLLGRTMGNGYVLRELLGVGAMGKVYRAEQPLLDRSVAIKVLHQHMVADGRNISRFYREARMASRLNHPNSITIIDFGTTADQLPFLVMELLRGRTLRDLIHGGETPSPHRACEIALDVLSALTEAHALGIVHRDLKPANVFLVRRRDGTEYAKVVDFGLARVKDGMSGESTGGIVCGTPLYSAPEQWLGEPTDAATDLYALGVVLFELLTGRSPFQGDPAQLLYQHVTSPAPSARELAPDRGITPVLDSILLQALEKRPSARFPSAEAMAEAIRTAMEGMSGPHRAPGGIDPLMEDRITWTSFSTSSGSSAAITDDEALGALVEADASGRKRMERGDCARAAADFHRGLTIARQAMGDTGEDTYVCAVLAFSRKLADALLMQGKAIEAQGVVEEALPLSTPRGVERGRLLAILGDACRARGRFEQALLTYTEVFACARDHQDDGLLGRARQGIERVRKSMGHAGAPPKLRAEPALG
jgi:serine/threonine protein kinase